MLMADDTEFGLPQNGRYAIHAVVNTGPIVIKVSGDGGTTYTNMTDGSFSVSGDGILEAAHGFRYKADIPVGDFLYLSPTDKG